MKLKAIHNNGLHSKVLHSILKDCRAPEKHLLSMPAQLAAWDPSHRAWVIWNCSLQQDSCVAS